MPELVITILTGGRPALLGRTLSSLERHSPQVLADARVVALVNGGDAPSVATVRERPWIDHVDTWEGDVMEIGAAVTRLWETAQLSEARYLFHLEDDWGCSGAWYDAAKRIFAREPKVGQVRLRRDVPQSAVGHAVMRYHMVTGAPLHWEDRRAGHLRYRVARAHLTFNPAVLRAELALGLFPCKSEQDAARKYHQTQLLVAQARPGAFGHLGTGELSLRERLGRGH